MELPAKLVTNSMSTTLRPSPAPSPAPQECTMEEISASIVQKHAPIASVRISASIVNLEISSLPAHAEAHAPQEHSLSMGSALPVDPDARHAPKEPISAIAATLASLTSMANVSLNALMAPTMLIKVVWPAPVNA